MAEHRLADFARETYRRLKDLARAFEKQGNEDAYGALCELSLPGLPKPVGNMTIDYEESQAANGSLAECALAEVDRLEAAAELLAGDEDRLYLADRLNEDAASVKAAVSGKGAR